MQAVEAPKRQDTPIRAPQTGQSIWDADGGRRWAPAAHEHNTGPPPEHLECRWWRAVFRAPLQSIWNTDGGGR